MNDPIHDDGRTGATVVVEYLALAIAMLLLAYYVSVQAIGGSQAVAELSEITSVVP